MMTDRQHDDEAMRRLLALGPLGGEDKDDWLDYAAVVGIGEEHVDALIAVACDPTLRQGDQPAAAVWAPVHAWRALGQLRAAAAVAPLLAFLAATNADDDDWGDDAANEDIPVVLGLIGPAAIAPTAAFVLDRTTPIYAAATALSALGEIAERTPECRDACIGILVQGLDPASGLDPVVCGFAVSTLLDLKAVEAIDAIRAAFGRDAIDMSIAGDLDDVEIDLGLRSPRRRTARPPIDAADWPPRVATQPVRVQKIGRNDPCPCGSGKKYKKCCLNAAA